MILNKKASELNDVDSLIEQLYVQTKQAYFKAQTSEITENMSPIKESLQKTSFTSLNKKISNSKFETVDIPDQSNSSSKCEISIAEKNSVSTNSNFNTRVTSSNFEKSINKENSDFEKTTRDVSAKSSSCSDYEVSTTKTNYDSKLETLTVEYSNFKRIRSNFGQALRRKLESQVMHSDTKVISSECQSKVVVQVLPQNEFGDKFDLLKSGISNSSFGFKPCSFLPISSMSSFIPQRSDRESTLSEEDCEKNIEAETNTKKVKPDGELVLLNSNEGKRKLIEEHFSSTDEKNLTSEIINTDAIKKLQNLNRENILTFENDKVKLCNFKYIAPKLAVASAAVIRTLHYILYGSYGLTRNEILMCQTKENILQFSGFPFDEESEIFKKKRNLLVNLPSVLYMHIYDILLNNIPENKQTSLEKLFDFLKKPSDVSLESNISEEERILKDLKEKAIQAQPIVKIEKLDEGYVNTLSQKNLEVLETASWKHLIKKKSIPQHKQQNLKLRAVPGVAENIYKARRRIINLLHSLLFGRPGSEYLNRKNILDFSGFKNHQKNFLSRRLAFLYRLKLKEVEQLCDVVTIPTKSGNKNKKIKKLLDFFSFLEPHQKKTVIPDITQDQICFSSGSQHSNKSCKEKGTRSTFKANKPKTKSRENKKNNTQDPICFSSGSQNYPDKTFKEKGCTTGTFTADKPKIKLRDFEKIHTNVECATPEDLTALNDLLYVKPCDSSEIHQKILEFSPFTFDITSFDFQYRRTLMHYMDLKTVKRIAKILDIEEWESCTNHTELSLRVLKFLMDMKLPEKKKLSSEQKLKKEKTHPQILKFCSSNIKRSYSKSRSCTPETFDSTYASEEVNEMECEEITPSSIYHQQNTPCSRLHYYHKDLSNRRNQILNDSTSLLDLMQHPTDKELLSQIDKIINNTSLSITMGELVKEVLNSYPKFDLHYRIDFIKSKAIEVLQELRLTANVFPD